MNNFTTTTTTGPLGPYSPPFVWQWSPHNIILLIILILSFIMSCWTLAGGKIPDAAYGKFASTTSYSPVWMNVDGRFAWWLMESPSVWIAFLFFFVIGSSSNTPPPNCFEPAPLVMFSLYEFHYIQRSCIYPFFLKDEGKSVSILIILASMAYNSINSYLQVSFISTFGMYPVEWLYDPRFIIGTIIYLCGYFINRHSDAILHSLRKTHDGNKGHDDEHECFIHPITKKQYRMPNGGMFEYVSAANYFGELTIWFGFAMLTWSLEGLSFLLLTFGNLAPRAARYHDFYLDHFPNYPKSRKALIPCIW